MKENNIVLSKDDISTDADGFLTSDQELKIKSCLQFTQNIIKTFGYNKENNQLVFRLMMFRSSNFSEKVSPLIQNLFEILDPVSLNEKIKMKTICILDNQKGYDGRYSLVMNSKNKLGIIKETQEGIALVKNFDSFSSITEALNYISKNLYYYDK